MALSLRIASPDRKPPINSNQFLSPHTPSSAISFSSASSTSTLSDLSPLPSPSFSPPKSKTSAFFSSPWSPSTSPAPISLPPLSPPRRSSSGSSSTSTATTATSASSALPEHDNPERRARTLNASFFSQHKEMLLPTPPPSNWSASSRDSSPPPHPLAIAAKPLPKPRLPLSRLFPSRFTSDASAAREFLDLDQTPRVVDPFGPEPLSFVASPTEASPTRAHAPWADPSRRIVSDPLLSPSPAPPPALPSPGLTRETRHSQDKVAEIDNDDAIAIYPLRSDTVLESPSTGRAFVLTRELGQGAFSHVWLATDVSANDVDNLSTHSRVSSEEEHHRTAARLTGTTPSLSVLSPADQSDHADDSALSPGGGRIVAVKLTDRALSEVNDRTRVSFIREVEVLKHISHRSIVSYITSFTTAAHHVLVLEHLGGGELFDLINSDEKHAQLDERLLRRMFGELSKAVGWMHSVGLVHRDIKLENILLTRNPLGAALPPRTTPILKLTDFGLARFIDPVQPLLATRCGSESYAAPELITGQMYDGRETDAWACGVVLFALATRKLPFDAQPSDGQPVDGPRARRKLLMRIAGGEYSWPCEEDGLPGDEETDDVTDLLHPAPVLRRGPALAASKGVREVVSRLLVRDPTKRASMSALWEESWMWGPGAPVAPVSASRSGSLSRKGSGVVRRRSRLERRRAATVAATDAPSRQNSKREKSSLGLELAGFPEPERTFSLPVELLPVVVTDDAGHYVEAITDDGTLVPDSILDGEEDVEEVEVEEHGALVDGDHIGDIARQELR